MARRRKSTTTTPQARDIALSIRQGERLGLTQREIGATLGINERTVRKIKEGQTSGTRTHARVTKTPKIRAETGLFNAEYVIGYDASGNEIVGSRNVTIPVLQDRFGKPKTATALDVFRIRGLAEMAAQERAALARRYGNVARLASADTPVRLRAIGRARRRTVTLRTTA